jgi:hypothetical protein
MKCIISIIFFLSNIIFAQANWTPVYETDINYGSAESYDLFTNINGNHVVVQESNLKYYRMDLDGDINISLTIESSSVISPSITGSNDDIFIVYRKNAESTTTVKRSS